MDLICSPVLGSALKPTWPSRCLLALYTPPYPACLPQALRMLVKMMHVHTPTVTRAILDQLCYSSVLEVSSQTA